MPKISVIVPVYKAEAYLHRCVDSLLAQTFTDFEMLLVDDGSPDRSGAICDEYARRDSRVRVFHKENGGVSSARQYGLDNALGDYTIHADPDDWVEPDMLEALYAKAIEEDADMVICDYFLNTVRGQRYMEQHPRSLAHAAVLEELLFQQLHGSCWNKLVRRACYKTFDVRFPQGFNLWEDAFVICNLLLNDIKVCYLNKAFYHYDFHSNSESLVHKLNSRSLHSLTQFIDYFEQRQPALPGGGDPFPLMKGHAKEVAFANGLLSHDDFMKLYSEINGWYVNEHPVRSSLRRLKAVPLSTTLAIQGHPCLGKAVLTAYRVLSRCYNLFS